MPALPLTRTLSVMLTIQCTASCDHCGTLSSPQARGNMDADTLLRLIGEARELGFGNVVFTGGEATLRHDLLVRGIEAATEAGLLTRLVSNAWWARSPEAAERRLSAYRQAGLSEVNYSTGDQHVRFVPLERVGLAVAAALRLGYYPHVMVEVRKDRVVSADDVRRLPAVVEAEQATGRSMTLLESPWMPVDPELTWQYDDGRATVAGNVALRKGCDSVLQTYTLMPDGDVKACCGIGSRLIPELTVGRTDAPASLESAIDQAEADFLKFWMRFEGPEKILAWCAQREPGIDWEGRYAHRCQACLRIYQDPLVQQVIRDHYLEVVPDILFSAWLDSEFTPSQLGDTRLEDPVRTSPPDAP